MKKISFVYLCIFLALFALITVLNGCSGQQAPKVCAIEEGKNTIIYNNTIYNEISDRYEFSKTMTLLFDERVDLASYYENSDFYYLHDNEYFIFKGDDPKSPIVIYKENLGFGTSGWLYVKDRFDYQFEDVENNNIIEFFLDIHPISWKTNNPDEIETINNAINNGEDLVPIISKYTSDSWIQLYARYENTPFVKKIGWQENGKFQYSDE